MRRTFELRLLVVHSCLGVRLLLRGEVFVARQLAGLGGLPHDHEATHVVPGGDRVVPLIQRFPDPEGLVGDQCLALPTLRAT